MKVKSESEVAQSYPTLSDPMGCSPPGSSLHGIFQARVLQWGAIAFSNRYTYIPSKKSLLIYHFASPWILSTLKQKEHESHWALRCVLWFHSGPIISLPQPVLTKNPAVIPHPWTDHSGLPSARILGRFSKSSSPLMSLSVVFHLITLGDGQEGLACCSSWSCKELDTTEQLDWLTDWLPFLSHKFPLFPALGIELNSFPLLQ